MGHVPASRLLVVLCESPRSQRLGVTLFFFLSPSPRVTGHGTRSTLLDPDEVVKEIQIPKPQDGAQQKYLKFTLRTPVDFAIVNVVAVITIQKGVCVDARIALGAVAPGPVRARTAEDAIIGKPIDEHYAAEAAEQAIAGAQPLSMNAYKVEIAKTLVKRAILG